MMQTVIAFDFAHPAAPGGRIEIPDNDHRQGLFAAQYRIQRVTL
jgi:hypothetical protein